MIELAASLALAALAYRLLRGTAEEAGRTMGAVLLDRRARVRVRREAWADAWLAHHPIGADDATILRARLLRVEWRRTVEEEGGRR